MTFLRWYSLSLVGISMSLLFYKVFMGFSTNTFYDLLAIGLYMPVFYLLTRRV